MPTSLAQVASSSVTLSKYERGRKKSETHSLGRAASRTFSGLGLLCLRFCRTAFYFVFNSSSDYSRKYLLLVNSKYSISLRMKFSFPLEYGLFKDLFDQILYNDP